MANTVIIFSSFAGKTRKVANYLAKKLEADIFDLKLQTDIDLSSFSRVIIGSGVHAGHAYGKVEKFIENNRDVLNGKDTYLFLSCLYDGDRADTQCSEISKEILIDNAVYFCTRGEKNEAGLNADIDAFIERLTA
ncbi:MAG: hypothetical protein MJZ21_06535 [archaeon]|nr:hypothetical protein [archaeon]